MGPRDAAADDHRLSVCLAVLCRSHDLRTTSILKLVETRWGLAPLWEIVMPTRPI
jgi:hypothetical protein